MNKRAFLDAKILVVDDEPANVKLIRGLLEIGGFKSIESQIDSSKASESFASLLPDLVILDLNMEPVDGFGVLDQIRPLVPHSAYMPVLVLTGDISRETREKALAAGAMDFLTKPFNANEILLRVKNLLHTRVLHLELQQRAELLEEANKELEAFSYSVSHDLRTPLRHIGAFNAIVQENMAGTLDEESVHALDTVARSVKKMDRLIDDLLSFSRMAKKEFVREPVDLNSLLKSVVRDLGQDIGSRNIEWRFEVLPSVQGDRAMLHLAFTNLIANAIKYTRPRDLAVIEVGVESESAAAVTLYIRDNGVGFNQEYADVLFGVFQRLHSERHFEGTGIGLANVKRIIDRHGGTVRGVGAVDAGATFSLSLPKDVH